MEASKSGKRRWVAFGLTVLATAGVSGGAVYAIGVLGSPEPAQAVAPVNIATEKVQRRDLDQNKAISGTLKYDSSSSITAQRAGIITDQPAAGSVVQPGQVLFRVDSIATVLLRGSTPAWREMSAASADGTDIAQLKQAMIDLGHGKANDLKISNTWTPALTRAVKAWQKTNGEPQTGTVALGNIIFLPEAVRIGAWTKSLGEVLTPGDTIAKVGATTRTVVVLLDAADRAFVELGKDASLEFPDGTKTVGKIFRVEAAPIETSEDNDSKSSLSVSVDVPPESLNTQLDGCSTRVTFTVGLRQNALTVPVTSLAALSGGGFGVQVQASDDSLRYVAVTTGVFAGTWVEITDGDLAEGDTVVVTP